MVLEGLMINGQGQIQLIENSLSNLIWKLVEFSSGELNLVLRKEAAINLLVHGLQHYQLLDKMVTDFASTPTAENLKRVRKYIANSHGLISDHRQILLVAELVRCGNMDLDEAAFSLSEISGEELIALAGPEQDIVEVAKIVVEDLQEGFLKIDDDNLFRNKLLSIGKYERK